MTLRDRIRRWWNPGKWRDTHPEISDGEPASSDTDLVRQEARGEADELLAKSALHKGSVR